jgi:hypothetical protein
MAGLFEEWQQQQQRSLRLCSFSSSFPKAVDMLSVLHPHSLTCVDLDLSEATTGSLALSAAIARLSSLQQLHLIGIRMADANRGDALTALARLSQLTALQLSGNWPMPPDDGQLQSLPLLGQPV